MKTTRSLLILPIALLALAAAGMAFGGEGHDHAAGELSVRGEVLDMACYMAHEAKGPDHAACAKRCVKGGQPMGLLAEDGTVYLLYANHKDGAAFEKAKEFAGEKVALSGVAATQAGVKGIEVSSVKKL